MDFSEVVYRRRMIRSFRDLPVPEESLSRILDLARRGPSAGFTQGQDFIVVKDKRMKKSIAELCGEDQDVEHGFEPYISTAPVLIVPCTSEEAYLRRYREADKLNDADAELDWPVPYWFMDAGCAMMIVLLAAVDEGLSAGFSAMWNLSASRELLGIPDSVTPIGVIPIGYAAPDKPDPDLKRGRRSIDEIVHVDRW